VETRSVFPFGFSDSAVTQIPILRSEIGAAKCETAKDHGHHQVVFVHYDPPFFRRILDEKMALDALD
jgi:hypothetical protein